MSPARIAANTSACSSSSGGSSRGGTTGCQGGVEVRHVQVRDLPAAREVEHARDLVDVLAPRRPGRASAAPAWPAGMDRSTSSRTTLPKRRLRSSSSIASSRSAASSSSIARSALRVTRKRCGSRTSMPGNSASRLAAMTCSSSTNVLAPDLHEARQDRRHLDPREAPLAGVGVAHRRRRATGCRSLMYGNGWPGSTASGVSTGKISSRNRCAQLARGAPGRSS